MAQAPVVSIGIESDPIGIRAVKLSLTRPGARMNVRVDGLSELHGDFSTDETLAAGLKKIKDKFSVSPNDRIATCLYGKQVYVAQIPFRRMPDLEMKNALRLELKKNLPFDAMGAFIDYQILNSVNSANPAAKEEASQIIVTAVPNLMLNRHLSMMEKLGMKPYTVDVQPLAIANAFNRTQESIALGLAYVVIHISSGVANLIICGDESVPFFHRSIYFAFDDLFSDAQNSEALAPENCEKTFRDLTDEIGRSIGFYEKTYSIKNFAGVFLLGDYVNDESIINAIGMKTKLPTEVIDIFGRLKQASKAPHGKFEVAVSLAMRNA